MNQIGFVEKIENNIATILVKRTSSCGDNCKSCGSGCNIEGIRIKLSVGNDINEGDYVEIESKTKNILKYVFILYGLPLLIMITTIMLIMSIPIEYNNIEILAVICGILSLLLSSIILKRIDKTVKKEGSINYYIKKVL